MMEEKCLDDNEEYGKAFQILSYDKRDIRNGKLNLRYLTLVNQNGFRTIFVFFLWTLRALVKRVVMAYK